MTRYEPAIQLRRLVVLKGGRPLYDEAFHPGVNIIRGENSSGKTTIADLIFYSLGGDVAEWSREAASADSVHAEVLLNGGVYTLSRMIERSSRAPMSFFEGTYDGAMSRREQWLIYPQSRSKNTDSFSQVLFRLLRMPEQQTDAQQNITMHQLLRLLYVDQTTPVNRIFRAERHDTKDIRLAVSQLLLGTDDLMLHDLRMRYRDLDRKHAALEAELSSMFRLLGKTADSDVATFDFQSEARAVQEERAAILGRVEKLAENRDAAARREATEAEFVDSQRLVEVNQLLMQEGALQQRLQLEISDSEDFVRALGERIAAIDAATSMVSVLGQIPFTFCPACLTRVSEPVSQGTCRLCKADLPEGGLTDGYLKMREELAFQLAESNGLLERRREELAESSARFESLGSERKRLAQRVEEFALRLDPIDAEMSLLLRKVGYLDRSAEDLSRKAEMAELLQSRIRDKRAIGQELAELDQCIEVFEAQQTQRREKLDAKLNELCVNALHRDLPMEEGLISAEVVDVDFAKDRIAVDAQMRFSASSETYLKNSVLFSLFELSLIDSAVRWPRFILMDNIEDKGMQQKRSANFQEYVVERSAASSVAHQVIFTTSMISESLEDSDYCVGPHYTETRKTLCFATGK